MTGTLASNGIRSRSLQQKYERQKKGFTLPAPRAQRFRGSKCIFQILEKL